MIQARCNVWYPKGSVERFRPIPEQIQLSCRGDLSAYRNGLLMFGFSAPVRLLKRLLYLLPPYSYAGSKMLVVFEQ